jgi:hypothetical protein
MSLISTQNFIAPFRSKFQIGAILVFAALIGMVRFANRSSQDSRNVSRASADTAEQAPVQDEVTQFLADRARSKKRAAMIGDQTVENLLDGDPGPAAARKPVDARGSDGEEPQKLNDIKRSLGLE